MRNNYILTGRGNLMHWLKRYSIDPIVYEVVTDYPIQITNHMDNIDDIDDIFMIDLAGGPKFVVGDTFENHEILNIEHKDKKIYITFK